jgi:quercetin dioxygenase-like cupin family protein
MNETTTARPAGSEAAGAAPAPPPQPEVHDPVHKTSYAFEQRGESLWVYTWFEPGAHLPEHFHPSYEERWEAVEGTLRVKLAGAWRDRTAADGPVLVERNVRHAVRNESGREVLGRTEVTPPGRLVEFLTESARAAREGLYNARNLPTSWRGALWLADFADRFSDDSVVTSPPPALQRLLLPPLARLARRRK